MAWGSSHHHLAHQAGARLEILIWPTYFHQLYFPDKYASSWALRGVFGVSYEIENK